MNVFIVYAHPEPKSFNGAMKDHAVAVLADQGHQVLVSDLYAMMFKSVADRDDFLARTTTTDYFNLQLEQRHAHEHDGLAPDIAAEQKKLLWADILILQFPLWWVSMPAILKGWVDRVFAVGFAYGGGKRYDRGGLKGRRAMLALTTGAPATSFTPTGLSGEINQLLFPIHHGILYFVGMEVLPPFVAYGTSRAGPEGRAAYLQAYRERLLTLDTTPTLRFHPLADYDETRQLRAGVAP